jgi:hypothetical protein
MNRLRTSPEESVTLHERRRITRPLRVVAGFTGFIMLSAGCMDSSANDYKPNQDATCAVFAAQAFEPGYEADRWSDDSAERDRLEEEITSLARVREGAANYAVCIDDEHVPRTSNVDRIAYLEQFFGTTMQGTNLPPGIEVPSIISPEEFENRFQTAIDPGHGF